MGSIPVGATFYFFTYLSSMYRIILSLLFLFNLKVFAQPLVLISKDKLGEISAWIKEKHPAVQTVECYGLTNDSLNYYLQKANALVLGGGEDIHPARYGKENRIALCGKIDVYRDSLEFFLLDFAFQKKLPTMGICRGMQLLNVYFGGDLMVDLPTDHPSNINHSQVGKKEVHLVKQIAKKSTVFDAMQTKECMVNSSHHQAIEKLNSKFYAVAKSSDGLIEAIEYKNFKQWFAFGIQWHPERLYNVHSEKLMECFLSKIQ